MYYKNRRYINQQLASFDHCESISSYLWQTPQAFRGSFASLALPRGEVAEYAGF